MVKWVVPAFVTVLALAATGARAAEHEVQIVEVEDKPAYRPAKVRVRRGDTVVWVNRDVGRDHTAVAADGSFDSGRIGSRESFSFTFEKAGKFPYGCNFHPRMKGVVEVTE